MNENKFTFAFVIALIASLGFCYLVFLGGVYYNWCVRDFSRPFLSAILLFSLLIVSVVMMCKGKTSRNSTLYYFLQIFFGAVLVGVLLWGLIPMSNFLNVSMKSKIITQKNASTCSHAEKMDQAYIDYVENRVKNYKRYLVLHQVPDAELRSQSLRRSIMPDSIENEIIKRNLWLESQKDIYVFNLYTPANIEKLRENVGVWLQNYKELSNRFYKGEEEKTFEYPVLISDMNELKKACQNTHISVLSVILLTIVLLLLLLPWWITEKDLASTKEKTLF